MMPFELFTRIIDQIHVHQSISIALHHFGESLLHPQLGECISYAMKAGVRTTLSCRPKHLTAKKSEELLKAGLTHITVCLEGIDTETLQAITGKIANFEEAYDNIMRLIRLKERLNSSCEILVQMINFKKNKHQQKAFLELWHGLPVSAAIKEFDCFTEPELRKQEGVDTEIVSPIILRCCFPGKYVVVLWDGRIVPCCHDVNGEWVLGTVDEGIEKIWSSERYGLFREKFFFREFERNDMCIRCSFWPEKYDRLMTIDRNVSLRKNAASIGTSTG
jgi:radical SAM protein with 4Fe4S-binding SPASM domain